MRVTISVPRDRLSYRFRIGKRKFLAGVKGPSETYSCSFNPDIGNQQQLILRPGDFTERDTKQMKDWNEISTFRVDIYDGAAKQNLHFTEPDNLKLISRIEWDQH